MTMVKTATVAAAATAAATEEATASSPHDDARPDGRLDHGAAAVRTEGLYRDHGRLVGGLCRALLRDRAEAEDATQQVFLAAHGALLNGTSPREPAAWLATIARNECWGRIRARMRDPLPTADADGEPSLSDPLAEAIRNADLAAMWSAVAALPRQQRDALLLREFGGLSYDELAAALAVSGPAVESLLFRARQGVRARLQTAYAGLTGGAWLEALPRLAGALGGGMAPVAAKVAAVGVGAAVATGGAVVAPRLLDHPSSARRIHPPRAAAVPARHEDARTAPIVVARTEPAAVLTVPSRSGGGARGEHSSTGRRGSSGGEGTNVTDVDDSSGQSGDDGTRGSSGDSGEAAGDTHGSDASAGGQGSSPGSSLSRSSSTGGRDSSSGEDGSSGGGEGESSPPAETGAAVVVTTDPGTSTVPTEDDSRDGGGSGRGDGSGDGGSGDGGATVSSS